METDTGLPLPDQGYGKKLLGGYHARIEGPYILYSHETDYYYMFLSFGGLDANGAYNIRVARSKNPDGPYKDAKDQDMLDCKGKIGVLFHDPSIQPYGVKLMGNYQFLSVGENSGDNAVGYLSPGHNSAFYDEIKQTLSEIACEVETKLKEVSDRTLEKLREMNPEIADSLNPVIPPAENLKW